jgi:hypothetical protein
VLITQISRKHWYFIGGVIALINNLLCPLRLTNGEPLGRVGVFLKRFSIAHAPSDEFGLAFVFFLSW